MSMNKKLSGLMAAAKRAFGINEEAGQEKSPYAKTYVLEYVRKHSGSDEVIKYEEHWALTPDIYEEAQRWHARKGKDATAEAFSGWLHGNGGKRHRAGGLPALIITRPDGNKAVEEYWRDGKPKNKPAHTDITKIPGVKDTTSVPPKP